jgi:formylglycine-generating enzyme required for sulfatase activity
VPIPSDQQPIKVVPKGLRSFDAHDADFFLDLLPGPRDRDGLPDSIRFWKARIEATDADGTFSVGLIYGPSGCGKSSLVKAGLVPRLEKSVTAVYVEATGEDTEARLLKGLRRHLPDLPGNLSLIDSLAALRQGRHLEPGQKVLLVLDQFEQWLHARRNEENTDLVQALRQCDGGRAQAIVLVRDDFGMAATRFMRALEIRLVEGDNFATVDLFDTLHARKVLAAFGRAYGRLPDNLGQCSKEQDRFLDQAVAGLAQDGKVVSVRLALFAEMVKGKPWTPATLKEVGGTEGVGVTFLEETFSASAAPPPHRLHQKAAQAVLKALLPEAGTDIKGTMRSQQELLDASGYASRPKDFDDLLRILDGELRLITPTAPDSADEARLQAKAGARCYQLTHDYLVHSLRDWLTRKQKETRRGRAELLLADRAAVWNARPENHQLPSLWQWLQARWHTTKKTWTPPQRKMMGQASRYHVVRVLVVALLLALVGWGTYEVHGRLQAHALRDRLLDAKTDEVPAIVQEMAPYRRWLDPLLRDSYEEAEARQYRAKQLHASLALLPVDTSQAAYLYGRLLDAQPGEVAVIRDALASHKDELLDKLWAVVEAPDKNQESQRLRAAAALAKYDRESEKWAKSQQSIGDDLVAVQAVHLSLWLEGLRPVRAQLVPHLSLVYRNTSRRETERSLAADILADYAADDAQVLANLLMDADEKQFAVIYPKFREQGEKGLALLTGEIAKKLPADLASSNEKREKLAKRQANAAVALLRLGQPEKVWPLLKRRPPDDPRVRSYLIHRFGLLGADWGMIFKRLDGEKKDVSIRRALLLSLGGFGPDRLTPADRERLIPKVWQLYREEPDAGLHGAAEWLLRLWGRQGKIKEFEAGWTRKDPAKGGVRVGTGRGAGLAGALTFTSAAYGQRPVWASAARFTQPVPLEPPPPKKVPAGQRKRQAREEQIKRELAGGKGRGQASWYVNGQGQTMVVIPGPVEFLMGSSPTEEGRQGYEVQHRERIGRTFALAARPVTVQEFRRFLRANPNLEGMFQGEVAALLKRYSPEATCPITYVDWYTAAAYCNWLSKEEGLPEKEWCYEANPQGAYGEGMKLRAGYLGRKGYRLPTEAEWEYACRAGAVTSRYYGDTEELLPGYGWYLKNSGQRTGPVGGKKPNDLGLFDMHGNVWSWCQERYRPYPKSPGIENDIEDILSINNHERRGLRGGSFSLLAVGVRCANRTGLVPSSRGINVGIRPARTFR